MNDVEYARANVAVLQSEIPSPARDTARRAWAGLYAWEMADARGETLEECCRGFIERWFGRDEAEALYPRAP